MPFSGWVGKGWAWFEAKGVAVLSSEDISSAERSLSGGPTSSACLLMIALLGCSVIFLTSKRF